MATHSRRVLAWRIPGMAEPGGLLSMGSHRVGHDWSDLAAAAASLLSHRWEGADWYRIPDRAPCGKEGVRYTHDCAHWWTAGAANPRHHQIQCPRGICTANEHGLTGPDGAAQVSARQGTAGPNLETVSSAVRIQSPYWGMRSQGAPSAENTLARMVISPWGVSLAPARVRQARQPSHSGSVFFSHGNPCSPAQASTVPEFPRAILLCTRKAIRCTSARSAMKNNSVPVFSWQA